MGKLARALGVITAITTTLLTGVDARAELKKITIGDVGSGSSLHWPAYIAMSKGLFEKAGIDIEYIPVQTSAGVFQQLSAGSLDLGSGGFPDPLRAIDKGGAITIFRTEGIPSPYELMVKPAIRSYADLKGKIVMIDTPKGNTRLYLERMITPHGLKYGDFDLVFAGATAARFQALASGAVDATLVNPPYNFKARAWLQFARRQRRFRPRCALQWLCREHRVGEGKPARARRVSLRVPERRGLVLRSRQSQGSRRYSRQVREAGPRRLRADL